jgi:hypothetical protein
MQHLCLLRHITPKSSKFQVRLAVCFVGDKQRPAFAVGGLFQARFHLVARFHAHARRTNAMRLSFRPIFSR